MNRFFAFVATVCVLTWPTTGCSQSSADRKIDGLTAVVFNYSDEDISLVRIDGNLVGSGYDPVRPGDVAGGGRSCCISLAPALGTVLVEIKPALADPYTVQATIEQPWPKGASTAIVHLLPGRRVVIETTLGVGIGPRSDLLNAQLEALGVVKEVDVDWMMIPERYQYSEYMERRR